MKTSKIFFVNEASGLVGMGHILRSITIAKCLIKRGHSASGTIIGEEGAIFFARKRIELEKIPYRINGIIDINNISELIKKNNPTVVVVDCLTKNYQVVTNCFNLGIPTVALDYFNSNLPLPSAIINLIDHHNLALIGQVPDRAGAVYLEGAQYAIIREEFLACRAVRSATPERENIRNILISFGGADPSGNTEKAIKEILKWPGKFNINIVIGPLFDVEATYKKLNSYPKLNLRILRSTDVLGELMQEADLIFCGGGGTLLEAVFVGLPAIVIAQNNRELRHAQSFEADGLCWTLDRYSWGDVSKFDIRRLTSVLQRHRIDGLGLERICNVIEIIGKNN